MEIEVRAVRPQHAIAGLQPAQPELRERGFPQRPAQRVDKHDQRRARIEPIAVARKRPRAPARACVLFEDFDAVSRSREFERCGEPRETRSDDRNGFHGCPAKRARMAWLEALHIACAVLWLGNFVVTGVWALRAWAFRDAQVSAFFTREILFTDAVFTLCFAAGVTASGMVLASAEGVVILQTLWTRTAIAIVAGAALVWLAVLLPIEISMHRRARTGQSIARLFAVWNCVGWLVSIALFAVIYLMVAKPT